MNHFCALCLELQRRTDAAQQIKAVAHYLQRAALPDAAWAVFLLAGGRVRAAVPLADLRERACKLAHIPPWLFELSHTAVGDLAETIAHVLPVATRSLPRSLAEWMEERVLTLRGLSIDEQSLHIEEDWSVLAPDERVLYTKLISGSFKPGLAEARVQEAIALAYSLDRHRVALRFEGRNKAPRALSASAFEALLNPQADRETDRSLPYPFQAVQTWSAADLVSPLAKDSSSGMDPVGSRSLDIDRDRAFAAWLVEWQWDGQRVQVLRRGEHLAIWSHSGELLNTRLPDVMALAQQLPDGTVLDGVLLLWPAGSARPAPRGSLQARLQRRSPTAKVLRDEPVRFMAFDLLEVDGTDLRSLGLAERRSALEALAASIGLQVSRRLPVTNADQLHTYRQQARAHGAEGVVLKRLKSTYRADSQASPAHEWAWWSWPTEALRIKAVLLYAQAAAGQRTSGAMEFSFAVWSHTPQSDAEVAAVLQDIRQRKPPRAAGLRLLPFAKTSLGLDAEDAQRLRAAVDSQTVGTFGPVRSLLPTLVVELEFDNISPSTRHKSGVVTSVPRMLRICDELGLMDAGTRDQLHGLLHTSLQATFPAQPGPAVD